MLETILNIITIFSSFCVTDRIINHFTNLQGIYYLIHSVHNGIVVYLTMGEVFNSVFDFNSIANSEKNLLALSYVFALHLYHIAIYKTKFRYDDWLHHILMIGVALPIGWYVDSKSLLGYSLFFTTGLPGGIDYILLFLVRNNWLDKNIEKEINSTLNIWIRSPGCISHAILTLAYTSTQNSVSFFDWFLSFVVACLTFWNGQYFMRQVVENNVLIKSNLLQNNNSNYIVLKNL